MAFGGRTTGGVYHVFLDDDKNSFFSYLWMPFFQCKFKQIIVKITSS
jgi:L-rhamnose mutarotase